MREDWWNDEPEGGWRDPIGSSTTSDSSPSEPKGEGKECRKLDTKAKVIAGVVAIGVVGLVVAGVSGGGEPSTPRPVGEGREVFLPPAGGFEPSASPAPPPRIVKLSARPVGRGDVGQLVEVTVVNETSEPVLLMSSLLEGGGRPAIVGEGTLAPGSRTVEPGGEAKGTVEFVGEEPPDLVVLTGLDGGIVATSGEGDR